MHKLTLLRIAARLLTAFVVLSPFSMAFTAHAQSGFVKVDVPFAFESGDAHLPPGVYRIHMSASTPFVQIDGDKSSACLIMMKDSSTRSSSVGKVVFRRYGSRYILKQVWMAGDTRYVRTPASKVEKQLEFESAQANTQTSQSDIALLATLR